MPPPNPVLKAILLCDTVITDKASDKHSLIGLFERVYVAKFPAFHFPACLFVEFTGAAGDYKIRVEFFDQTSSKALFNLPLPNLIKCPDRLKAHRLVFRLPPMPFPQEGDYEIRVYANDHILCQKTLQTITRR